MPSWAILPASLIHNAISSSVCRSRISATRHNKAARSATGVCDHEGNVACAVSIMANMASLS